MSKAPGQCNTQLLQASSSLLMDKNQSKQPLEPNILPYLYTQHTLLHHTMPAVGLTNTHKTNDQPAPLLPRPTDQHKPVCISQHKFAPLCQASMCKLQTLLTVVTTPCCLSRNLGTTTGERWWDECHTRHAVWWLLDGAGFAPACSNQQRTGWCCRPAALVLRNNIHHMLCSACHRATHMATHQSFAASPVVVARPKHSTLKHVH